MKKLLKNNEQRQLNLIEILYVGTEPISISEMAEKLGYSERAITHDIVAIQDKFPFLNVKVINRKITMDIASNYNLSYVYQSMFKSKPAIKLLERLFLYKQTKLGDLTKHLEVSQATVYRLITQVNEVASQKYGFKLDTNPFQIEGQEEKIRVFFFQLFSDIYNLLEWPFVTINETALTDLVIEITNTTSIPVNYIDINYMKYLVAVNLVRLKQGYDIPIDKEKSLLIYKRLQSTTFMNDKTKLIMTRLGVPLNQHTLEQLFYVFINFDFIFSDSKFINTSKNIDKRIDSFNNLNYVVETLKQEFDLKFDNPGFLILNLHNAVILSHQSIDSENIIDDNKLKFIEEFSNYFPDFISRASKLFQDYCLKMGIEWDQSLRDQLIYELFIQWKTLYTQLAKNNQVVEIAILCKYDAKHAYFLKEYFEFHFGTKFRFNIYDETKISVVHLKNISETIILSTFHLPLIEGKNIININFFPSVGDLYKLFLILKKERAKNEQKNGIVFK